MENIKPRIFTIRPHMSSFNLCDGESVLYQSHPTTGLIIPTPDSNVLILRRQIGRGSFSTCWLARLKDLQKKRPRTEGGDLCSLSESEGIDDSTSNPYFVVKVINPGEKPLGIWKHESVIHQKINHPNIVLMFSAFMNDKMPICVLEWCRGGTLSQLAKNTSLDVAEISHFTHQLLDVLRFLHCMHVVHRDIKPNNILLNHTFDHIKLCDFGLAVQWDPVNDDALTKITGTPNYVAPEIIHKDRPGYGNLVDCWSLGCSVYYMYTGHPLYQVNRGDKKALYRAIRKETLPAFPPRCVGPMHTLLLGLLQKNPAKRLTAQEGLHILR
jgi:serine/threonine protein kinase